MTRVGIAFLPEVNPAHDDRWARIERWGFAHGWCLDHLAWRDLAGSPWHATIPVLTAAAMTTSRMGIGTFVASPNFRHPVPFAKELMTLDVISNGRLQVAAGAGTLGFDATILNRPRLSPSERMDRFEEFITLLDRLLSQSRTTWSGNWFGAVDAPNIPGCLQRVRPPFVIAANGPRGMRLAQRLGQGWVTMGTAAFGATPDKWWQGVADAAHEFDAVARTAGGLPDGFRRYLDVGAGPGPPASIEKVCRDISRAGELGYTDVVLPWTRRNAPFAGDDAVLEALGERLDEHGNL